MDRFIGIFFLFIYYYYNLPQEKQFVIDDPTRSILGRMCFSRQVSINFVKDHTALALAPQIDSIVSRNIQYVQFHSPILFRNVFFPQNHSITSRKLEK